MFPRWTSELSSLSEASLSSIAASTTADAASTSVYGTSTSPTHAYPSATSDPYGTSTYSSSNSASSVTASATSTIVSSVTSTLSSTTVVTGFSDLPNSSSTTIDVVCAGHGVDASGAGVIASLVFTAIIGALIWLLFAILRPRIRALYAVREWFVRPESRPQPLRSTLWAFLFPPVPLVPALSSQLPFPSDGELAQRTIWVVFLLVLGWTLVGLIGALPLYLVDTPCLADSYPRAMFGGRVSSLQDLSLLRLLKMYDEGQVATNSGLARRAIVDGSDRTSAARVRLIILIILLLVVVALPALFKLLHEWTKVLACRRRWLDSINSVDVVWLPKDRAPGFDGWGEGRVKDLLVRSGLTSKLGGEGTRRRHPSGSLGMGVNRSRSPGPGFSLGGSGGSGRSGDPERATGEEVDVHGVFTIVDTSHLEDLVRQRATVLENLEVAEALYIRSFQLASPDDASEDDTYEGRRNGPRISRPRPLGGGKRISQLGPGRHGGPTPTNYVAPSSYYKLRNVNGITGGRITSSNDSLAFRISQRVIGSRFQEVTRESVSFGRLPLGSKVRVGQTGELAAMPPTPALNTTFGPNHAPPPEEEGWEMTDVQHEGNGERRAPSSWFSSTAVGESSGTNSGPSKGPSARDSVVTPKTARRAKGSSDEYNRQETSDGYGRRGTSDGHGRRGTSDGHGRSEYSDGRRSDSRSRRRTVFRPASGLDHESLALIYDGIRTWRSELKQLNAAVTEAQQEAFTAIADGQSVKGWLLVGRNVRYLAGVQPIEGRAKADVRWHELQEQGGTWSNVVYWVVVAVVGMLLAVSLVPVAGLALAGAPDVVHFFTLFRRLSDRNDLGAALATTFAPAVAATLFISIALVVINYAAKQTGAISVSDAQLRAFKATFYVLVFVATVWIIAVGALIFGIEAIDTSRTRTRAVADGTTYIAVLLMVIILNAAVIAPGILMLQPIRLWKVWRAQKKVVTPRQNFRAIYPRSFNPSFALGSCVLAVVFSSTFSLIFPLIGLPILLLILLSLVAYRYMVGYVWARTDAPSTGGLLQLWLLRRFATLLALQPILMGLIFLSRRLWALAGILFGAAVLIIIIVETYCRRKLRTPSEDSFSPVMQNSLTSFRRSAHGMRGSRRRLTIEEDGTSLVSSPAERGGVPRGSIASVLDMMSITLNVMPSAKRERHEVPIETEDIDDLVSTERAAHTHPDAAPVIPASDHATETAELLYPPELLAPAPLIWLPHDRSGIARNEAYDLSRYHDLDALIDPGDGYSHEGDSSKRPSGERTPTPRHERRS